MRLDLDLGTLSLYHHVSILNCHKLAVKQLYVHFTNCCATTYIQFRCLFPDSLLDETIQTIALLIPRSNIDCKVWYNRQKRLNLHNLDFKISDLTLSPVAGRKPGSYKYWNERLSILYKAFNESQPNDLRQFWKDRRNKVQWYTFWIAIVVLILTLVFGLIQSITGILQVNLAYHPVR